MIQNLINSRSRRYKRSVWWTAMSSAGSVLSIIALQVLWVFRLFYELVLPDKSVKPSGSCPKSKDTLSLATDNEKRHLIHLFTTTPRQNHRPICYMDVSEIITPIEEEMLRCACAKGSPGAPFMTFYPPNTRNPKPTPFPPTKKISRDIFTMAWMDSFSLLA